MTRAAFCRAAFIYASAFLPHLGAAQDLTGVWRDNLGAKYIVRQLGDNVCWSVEQLPYFANVFCGIRVGQTVFGMWLDLPTGQVHGGGHLVLRVESATRFVKESSTTNYGSASWTREGNAPPAPQAVPQQNAPPPASGSVADNMTLPATMNWESDGGVRGTWTRGEYPTRYNAVYVHPNGRRVTTVEDVGAIGTSISAFRQSSSEGILCYLTGKATQLNPLVLEGQGDCYNGIKWNWRLTTGSAAQAPAAGPAISTGGLLWQSDGGWTGTWTRRGNSNVFDALYTGPGGEQFTAIETVTSTAANQVTVTRTNASNNTGCTFTGTVQNDPFVMEGTGGCSNGARGRWKVSGPAPGPATTTASAGGETWSWESSGGWIGTWTRRGTSNTFDAVYVNGNARVTAVESVTISGNQFSAQRLQSADGNLCSVRGTWDAATRSYSGTGTCPNGQNGWAFKLTGPTRTSP